MSPEIKTAGPLPIQPGDTTVLPLNPVGGVSWCSLESVAPIGPVTCEVQPAGLGTWNATITNTTGGQVSGGCEVLCF